MVTEAGQGNWGRVLELFARMLEYPGPDLPPTVEECLALLADVDEQAAGLLARFQRFIEKTPRGVQEELYTATFDLDTDCYPYVGFYLFGESYKRSLFLLELKKRYRSQGFATQGELPDHLSTLLRFLAVSEDADLNRELVDEALLPALDAMIKEAEETPEQKMRGVPARPYELVLCALRSLLRSLQQAGDGEQRTVFSSGGGNG